MSQAVEDKNKLSDKIFDEGRLPTLGEYALLKEYQDRHDNCADLLATFFQEAYEPTSEHEKPWDVDWNSIRAKQKRNMECEEK